MQKNISGSIHRQICFHNDAQFVAEIVHAKTILRLSCLKIFVAPRIVKAEIGILQFFCLLTSY